MAGRWLGLVVAVAGAACGRGAAHPVPLAASHDLTLYRDVALVRQRIELRLPAGASSPTIQVAAGVTGEQLSVLDRGGLELHAVHVAGPVIALPAVPSAAAAAAAAAQEPGEAGDEPHPDETEAPAAGAGSATDATDAAGNATTGLATTAPATSVTLDVTAPRAGTYAIVVTYPTNRLQWDADYTMTTSPARDLAVLRGAIAVRNLTAIAFEHAAIHVVDAALGDWRARSAEHLANALVGATPSTTPAATPRDVGIASLVDGETRVELTGISEPRAMHSVLVYDPIGTRLDNAGTAPVRDDKLGVAAAAATRITESFEVARDERVTRGLPAGPVRLFERRDDGRLAVLGEARLFDAATRVADVDTIAVGTAEGVLGHRTRRELTVDDARQRLTEEFVITLDNARDHEVGVLVREHLYRGQNWHIAFASGSRLAKEGGQQFSMRGRVPARGQQKLLYVVVYTWDREK